MAAGKRVKTTKGAHGGADSRALPLEPKTKLLTPPLPWDRVLEVASRQLDQFISLEPKVLKGNDLESIHDMRVASRRLQQILDLLYPPPRPPKVRKLRRTIRRARRALSVVRNCDVLLDRADRMLARKRTSRREVWAVFREYVRERQGRSFRKASRRLGKLNLPSFYIRLREHWSLPSGPPSLPGLSALPASTPPSEDAAPPYDRIVQALQETWSSLETGVKQAQGKPGAETLHAVRIAAKKVRYLLEVAHELEVSGSDQALACLRHLQRHLGEWHDLEILGQMMLEMVARPGFLQDRLELAMEVEKLVLQNRRSKRSYEERLFRMTKKSEAWTRLTGWVHDFISAGFPRPREDAKEAYSPAFPLAKT